MLLSLSGGRPVRLDAGTAPGGASGHEPCGGDVGAGSLAATGIVMTPPAPIEPAAPARPVLAPERESRLPALAWSRVGMVVVALVVVASACYPLTATFIRASNRFAGTPHTLDAYEWMDYGRINADAGNCYATTQAGRGIGFEDDRAAIDWFNANVDGAPVIAELSRIPAYVCFPSRFSISTGLPTILGWQNHESQQRYPDELGPRLDDVETLYDSSDPQVKLDILRQFDVQYVVVGALERGLTERGRPVVDPAGLAAFEGMVGTSLEVAFQQGGTTVYRVLPVPTPTT